MDNHTDVVYVGCTIFSTPTKEGGRDTQQGCLILFAKIREMVCPRLGAGNALSGGGKLSEKQRPYVGGVTDSCLACSTPDRGESSVWTCCGTAYGGQNDSIINIRQTQLVLFLPPALDLKYIISASYFWKMCVCILSVSVHTSLCVCVCVRTLSEPKTRFPACSVERCCKSS